VVNGPDPALFIAGFEYLPDGQSEYDFAGAIKGAAIEVMPGPVTGLPVPASAEIILEGELLPMKKLTLPEGPFGEFTGYYAADKRPSPVMEVKAIHHRDDPILLGSPPMKPPRFHFGLPFRAASIWSNLEMAGVTDVVGVWQHVAQLMTVVSVRQRYAGHAKQALITAAGFRQGDMKTYYVVVDDDIDPTNLNEVLWAMCTRVDPATSIDILHDAWTADLDPRVSPARREAGDLTVGRMLINACRPFTWRDQFPKSNVFSPEERKLVETKWRALLESAGSNRSR